MKRRVIPEHERTRRRMKKSLRGLKGRLITRVDTRMVDGYPDVVGVVTLDDASKLSVSWVENISDEEPLNDEVTRKLLRILNLYPNYSAGSRGPRGLLCSVIQSLRPDIAKVMDEGALTAGEILERFFPDDD